MKERILFFDLARCIAAVAVIFIHIVAAYRRQLGDIPCEQWMLAVIVDSVSRWAVPLFILLTGALMLSDQRPFEPGHYIKRRLGKVLLPFLIWSIFYAYLSGWTAIGYDSSLSLQTLKQSQNHATYYHLGFFYYFIPLYFVIPFLQILTRKKADLPLYFMTSIWLLTTLLRLLGIHGIWDNNLWLYSGYLPLGYVLFKKIQLNQISFFIICALGFSALVATASIVVSHSLTLGRFWVGHWLSYKTLNVVLEASMVFMLCRNIAPKLSTQATTAVAFISRYSLGIYLLHPLFLWPMKIYIGTSWHPLSALLLWGTLSFIGSLTTNWLLSRSSKTAWLLP